MLAALRKIDYTLVLSLIPLLVAGLITMKTLGGGNDYFFDRQLIWVAASFAVFILAGMMDWSFLRNGALLFFFYLLGVFGLITLLILGKTVKGAASWIDFSFFSLEPAEPMKIILILVLAKYFARRHVAIANIKHILVSGFYAFLPAALVLFQPDLGSAVIFAFIWLGMVLVSGISKKHLFFVFLVSLLIFLIGWQFVLQPYQKARIMTFVHPLADVRGAGYNAYQSMLAVGSGQVLGKGIGFGTQSRLSFLPEHETDFIFAAFAEEWGFVGVLFLFLFFGIVLWRVLRISFIGSSNFERLFSMGMAILIFTQIFINVGMNIGLLPITGITLPFMSYGGSALFSLFIGLGILAGMAQSVRMSDREPHIVG